MPADEVTHGADVEASRVRTGPRHAAPKKPLFTRFHMPAGKAIALAAMPTAVLMGMGFTPTLAQADDQPSSRNLTADEFKECLEAIEKAEKGEDASASPTPSATPSGTGSEGDEPSADPTGSAPGQQAPDEGTDKGTDSSPDSGSDDEAGPTPTPSATAGGQAAERTEPTPSPPRPTGICWSRSGTPSRTSSPRATRRRRPRVPRRPRPSPPPSGSEEKDDQGEESPQKPSGKAAETAGTGEKAGEAVEDLTEKAEEAVEEESEEPEATASPSPSESSGVDLEDCPVATDAEGGVDNNVPLPDDPWYLNASSLLLKGADYKGIVEVRTANGTTKKVLKYVISDGTDIGDLHQTVKDKQSGKTYHVQAAKGSTSTIRDGDTVMYTESISGNLLGLIPITFDPENPPPLNIPLIYFTKVTVQQAGQFGGTLHVPGLQQYVTD